MGNIHPPSKFTKQDIEGTESNSVTKAELRDFESNCNNYWERIENEIKKIIEKLELVRCLTTKVDKLQHEFKVIKETTSHIRADVVLQEEKICNLEKQQKSENILWKKKYDKIHEETNALKRK